MLRPTLCRLNKFHHNGTKDTKVFKFVFVPFVVMFLVISRALTYPKRLFILTNSRLFEIRMRDGQIAQLVEQRTENPRVGGSTPSLATNF